ncbi:MAG: hypothetical protein K2Y37_15975 [Pirellulales bacterium]|nr:hypothetical protein [Pirellulales bacterium]
MPDLDLNCYEQILSRARQLEMRVMDLQSTLARLRDEFDAAVAEREATTDELTLDA